MLFRSKAVRIVIRETLACAVFFPVVEVLSDPDFWNKTIDEVVNGISLVEFVSLLTSARQVQLFINSEKRLIQG